MKRKVSGLTKAGNPRKVKPGAGRPHLVLDVEKIRDLAAIHCTMAEIASIMKCNVDTLTDNFSEIIKVAREGGKESLRRAQWKKAVYDGNPALLIWCGKFYLGQKEELSIGSTEPEVRTLLEKWDVKATRKSARQIEQEKQKRLEDGEPPA